VTSVTVPPGAEFEYLRQVVTNWTVRMARLCELDARWRGSITVKYRLGGYWTSADESWSPAAGGETAAVSEYAACVRNNLMEVTFDAPVSEVPVQVRFVVE
jgi:hypothetical protein